MYHQRGNFLIQALLALTLVFAFIPFFAGRLATRDIDAKMYSATHQIETAQTAAKLFVQENANNISYGKTLISDDKFSETLEPYGLPIGFVPRTALGQSIKLIINKDEYGISAFLRVSGAGINTLQRAELARRIGFFASYDTSNPDGDIDVGIQLGEMYSDIVRRNETNYETSDFLIDLDMGGFQLDNVANVFARRATVDTGQATTLAISGTESGRREKNNIEFIKTDKTVFQTGAGESALSLTRGTLSMDTLVARTVSKFGETGNMTVGDAAIDSFDMSTGKTGFTGPEKWNVGGNVATSRITFNTDQLDVSSFINLTRGQDVFIDYDTLSYNTASGIDTDYIYSSHITLRDQTSSSLVRGGDGATILDIRPAGTSVLPDALVNTINNDAFVIIAHPAEDNSDTVTCESVVSKLGVTYNQKSLAQYIVCQYVFWQRLEHRINVKQCLIGGGSGCK